MSETSKGTESTERTRLIVSVQLGPEGTVFRRLVRNVEAGDNEDETIIDAGWAFRLLQDGAPAEFSVFNGKGGVLEADDVDFFTIS